MNIDQRIIELEKRVADLEKKVAAATTTDIKTAVNNALDNAFKNLKATYSLDSNF